MLNHEDLSRVFRGLLLVAAGAAVSGCTSSPGNCGSVDFLVTVPAPTSQDPRPPTDAGADAAVSDAAVSDASTAYTQAQCATLCAGYGANIIRCATVIDDAGVAVVGCYGRTPCVGGRAPKGYAYTPTGEERDDPGAWLASVASLEGASVVAFESLADQLVAHGAPAHFADEARVAADDERRHAARIAELAARYGRSPAVDHTAPQHAASLEALARENAIEGCVRETWGALLAHLQTSSANDPCVRDAMRPIAAEETAHASLSWQLAAWFDTRLDADAKMRVRAERDRAVEALFRDAQLPWSARCERELGLPSPAATRALLDGLRRDVWSA